jgi:type VI secretion system protein ImpC
MVRDKIGGFATREGLETWLNKWISRYVDSNPNAPDEVKAKFPLSQAEVVVEEDPENPGYYSSKFYLKPHYQLEGLTVSLRLVSKLPKEKK